MSIKHLALNQSSVNGGDDGAHGYGQGCSSPYKGPNDFWLFLKLVSLNTP